MQSKKISTTKIVFWALVIALISAISTTIFSETILNDSFGFSLMAIAIIGLSFSLIHICLHTILDICNPTQ